jgi:antitoxin HicB
VNRILNLEHKTKIDTIAQALGAMGKRLELSII